MKPSKYLGSGFLSTVGPLKKILNSAHFFSNVHLLSQVRGGFFEGVTLGIDGCSDEKCQPRCSEEAFYDAGNNDLFTHNPTSALPLSV